MNYLIIVDRGSGAEFMQVSVIRDFAAEHKSDKVYVSAQNKCFADMLAMEAENVESVDRSELFPLFTSMMADKKSWRVLQPDVYRRDSFFLREDNYYDCYREALGMKRRNDWSAKGSEYTPFLGAVPEQIKRAAAEFASQHPKLVLFQRQGGINPVCPHEERIRILQEGERGLRRAYPLRYSEEVVKGLQERGYEVLQYCLPEEPHVRGTLYMNQEQSQLFYYELSKYAAAAVCIDSSLMHLAVHNISHMAVIWAQSASGGKDCRGFGYQKAHNLFAHNYRPVSPYFNGMPDTPAVDYVKPGEVLAEFDKMMAAEDSEEAQESAPSEKKPEQSGKRQGDGGK